MTCWTWIASKLHKALSYSFDFCSHDFMKRNPDLIRHLLLALENSPDAELLRLPSLQGYASHQVEHHFRLLLEAGLVTAGYISADGRRWIAVRLTWDGHEYLERMRDPAVWRETKKAMGKAGVWSLETMGAVAKAIIMIRLESLGLELGS